MLPNSNYLKPTVWAEDAYNPKKSFATSLCVRSYLRPLYLFSKLHCLCESNNTVPLGSLKIFKTMMDRHRPHPETKVLKPCASCQVFFGTGHSEKEEERHFSFFGNCAEFDIIQTEDSHQKLRAIRATDHWKTFKSACKKHLDAFKKLRKTVRIKSQRLKWEDLVEYFEETRDTKQKALRYKWIPSRDDYGLVSGLVSGLVDYEIVSN